MRLSYLLLFLISTSAVAADYTISKPNKRGYNVYDWNTGNTYYGQYNGKRTIKLYPKTIVDDDKVLYPRGYTVKGPYDGDPYSDD